MEEASRPAGNTTKQDDRAACAVAGGTLFNYSLASHSSIACQTRAFFFVLAETERGSPAPMQSPRQREPNDIQTPKLRQLGETSC
jgi:hypothetical protein